VTLESAFVFIICYYFAGGRGYSSSRNEMSVHAGKDCRCGESPPGVVVEENEQEDGG
jgi:hypothetical protein